MSYTTIAGELKWPFARIPFEIDELSFPAGSAQRTNIDNAVAAWNGGSAVVRIVPRNGEPDYVRFVPDELVTQSPVGRVGGLQTVQAAYFPAVPAGATVAAIEQVPGQIDCFYFDAAGALRVNWVVGLGTWTGPVALTGPGVGQPGQPIVAARQLAEQIDVLFVDGNGVVNVMWVVGSGGWSGPVGLTPPGTAVPFGPLAAERQTDNQLDVFFVDGNGVVNVIWVIDGGVWQGPVGLTAAGAAPAGAALAAAHQTASSSTCSSSTATAS